MQEISNTQQEILRVGKEAFLEKGFKDASLRQIVKQAGFTQGAFYGYYPDKAALFEAIVSPVYNELYAQFVNAQNAHFELIEREKSVQTQMLSKQYLLYFLEKIYEHYDIFKLLVCCSEGTKYENFIHDLVELDVNRTMEYFALLRKENKLEGNISHELHHMITSAYFTAVFETVVHDMPKERALLYAEDIARFFESGWGGLVRYL